MDAAEQAYKDKRDYFDNLNDEKSRFEAQEEQQDLEREEKKKDEEAKRARADKVREKDKLTKDKKRDGDEFDKLAGAATAAEEAWKKTITDSKKDGNPDLKAKFDKMDKRRKALKASVDALKTKLGDIETALSGLDDADKKRKEDAEKADGAREKALNDAVSAA